jgi:predicted phosphodiesterase
MHNKERILDDFEHGDLSKYDKKFSFVHSYDLSICKSNSKYGSKCLKLTYHFGGWTTGNGAMYILFNEKKMTKIRPVKLGMWIHGDGKSPWIRATLIDGFGERKTVNLTEKNIDWVGWKYVDAPIDPTWALPLSLEQIYAVETDKSLVGDSTYKGEIRFDQIRFVYIDDEDLVGPIFSNFLPAEDVIYHNTFTLSVQVFDEMTGVDPETILLKHNGEKLAHQYVKEQNRIRYKFDNLYEGEHHISIVASDFAGNISMPSIDKKIIIDLSPDEEKPVISEITPRESAICYTGTPRISFNVTDVQSGINESDIKVTLHGEQIDIIYDEKTGWCYGYSVTPLDDGEHSFTILVKDRAGNQLGPIKNKFFIKKLPEPSDCNQFSLAVIPDTHDPNYAEFVFLQISKHDDVPFVIHMGDMVDQATSSEFEQVSSLRKLLKEKKLLAVAGNHESFQGNLDLFMRYFGSATFHLEYGNLLLVILNSAYDQSISKSDSIQFHYLETLLKRNNKKNIVIATHVPLQDKFGTSHGMVEEDVTRLTCILRDYKGRNPDVTILFLFGHLHVSQRWIQEDIQYIISGNAAPKGYVANENGNIHGYGLLHVSPTGMKYEYIPFIKKINIFSERCNGHVMHLKKGEKEQLKIRAFFEVLDLRYDVEITEFHTITKQWTTSNASVISINQDGMIVAENKGCATITTYIAGQKSSIKITVL